MSTAEKSKTTEGFRSAACLPTDHIAVSGLLSKNNKLCDFKNSISASVRIKSGHCQKATITDSDASRISLTSTVNYLSAAGELRNKGEKTVNIILLVNMREIIAFFFNYMSHLFIIFMISLFIF